MGVAIRDLFSGLILCGIQCYEIGFEVRVVAGPAVRNNRRNRFAAAANPIRAIKPVLPTASTVTLWVWVITEVKEVIQMDDNVRVHVVRQKVVGYPKATLRNQVLAVGHFGLEISLD